MNPRGSQSSDAVEASGRAIARAVVYARFSGGTLVLLGLLSALVSARHPVSAGFAISVAVVANGVIELREAARLRRHDPRAPRRMALNQLALGLEIAAYSAWQVYAVTPEMVQQLLARPMVAGVLELVEPAVLEAVVALVPPMIRLLYLIVGFVAVAGCGAVAWFYRSRSRHLAALAGREAAPSAEGPPPLP